MKKLVIEFSNERLITPSGLSLVGQMLGKSNFIKKCNNMKVDGKRSQSQIKNGDILFSYIGLLCQGKTSYDAINEMSDDPEYYKLALGITRAIPSAETLRQRMDGIGSSLREEILNANVAMFHTFHVQPSALESGLVPLDLDVTPLDNSKTHKEGVAHTYKGFDLCTNDGIHWHRGLSCKYRAAERKSALPVQYTCIYKANTSAWTSTGRQAAVGSYGRRE